MSCPRSRVTAPVTSRPGGKRILLVDDDELMREFVGHILREAGYTVLEASNGTEAIALARQRQPHLVISDVVMENGDGYAALHALREDPATALVPIVLMTANADLQGMRHGMSLGADDYLPKPFSAEALRTSVETQLKKQDLLRRQSEKQLEELRFNLNLALPHEFNTPLNGILGSAQLLKECAAESDPDTVVELADCIIVSGNRLYRVAHNFLTYAELEISANDPARLAVLHRQRTPEAGAVARVIAGDIAESQQRTNDLRLDAPLDLPVAMPEAHWRKIVEELVQNAFKFSRAGSPVLLRLQASKGGVSLVVSDQGRGMSPEQITRIGAYAQFDRKVHAQEGLGLGLAIARRLAVLYHGTLLIESAPATGTTVTITLPERTDSSPRRGGNGVYP